MAQSSNFSNINTRLPSPLFSSARRTLPCPLPFVSSFLNYSALPVTVPQSFVLRQVANSRSYGAVGPIRATAGSSGSQIKESIETEINENPVVVYSKTWCPYCQQAKGLFEDLGVKPYVVELDELGKTFYTYTDFINAANSFSSFGTTGTSDENKREIVAFFANVAHETRNLCYVEEIAKSEYCDSNNTQYPCASGQQYYGRGPLQLTGNANHGATGTYLGVDLLNNPGLVAQDDLSSWKTALWFWNFWNVNNNCHTVVNIFLECEQKFYIFGM